MFTLIITLNLVYNILWLIWILTNKFNDCDGIFVKQYKV